MSAGRGSVLALGSVLLVSGAQLGMRWGMSRLPPPDRWLDTLVSLDPAALLVLAGAVLAYALSMLCWLVALDHLPLGRAYSLLSLSYALVYLGAAWLPGLGEPLGLSRTLGVGLVIAGVITINAPRRRDGTNVIKSGDARQKLTQFD
ncbi:4-amino-4-deoxy-L-arabinose-phosphoundecaprenol flippase subunit ArnF [Pseudomonas sp. ATCC 13867]|uniref:4-amino-4-deoxy-L-arabinose-phosphoundecaprenol flippase subunit ArnF n=1 Tax=Pseudomonas sp. ATCC 13867 TaxID=1294143 RepID=UPI0002C4DDF0|nr:4-amino-4-deoxy-L-arabinose-phosphoundecaprenol flippase subunit ArnF [Pseudomonas sp. ATCC 13867]AGI22884.1 4-amino-4-deoxy-L-arabinose-phosphoundecaprenol flippase subunit ArnF [Pseudomonas sp. ATCC 13867]RFQ36069.1 4-amino-4-deoxy-L-arabinose-phosphoundecaprenol flippase subunit ArnF [Pseudomonas sp. ATCC 13867]